MLREYSRRLPSAILHIEAALQAQEHGVSLNCSHVHREGNVWADALANGEVAGFTEALRYAPPLDDSFFDPRRVNLCVAAPLTGGSPNGFLYGG